jgi:hypothetical protein
MYRQTQRQLEKVRDIYDDLNCLGAIAATIAGIEMLKKLQDEIDKDPPEKPEWAMQDYLPLEDPGIRDATFDFVAIYIGVRGLQGLAVKAADFAPAPAPAPDPAGLGLPAPAY